MLCRVVREPERAAVVISRPRDNSRTTVGRVSLRNRRPQVEYVRTAGHRKWTAQSTEGARTVVEAVGIERPAAHPIPMIPERFRGQVSIRTRPKNTSETRCRTFLWQCHKSLMWIGSLRRLARCSGCWMCSGGAADA